MKKHRKAVVIGALALVFIVVGVLYIRHIGIADFNSRGPIAERERNLIYFALLLSLVVVIPVYVMLFTFAWRYRASNTKAKYTPDFDHSRAIETIWWVVPTILITILSIVTWNSSHTLDPFLPLSSSNQGMAIQVIAMDWKWLFIYPQQKIATVNYLQIPKNTPISFFITSDAPMNSFWIPQLGGQIYAMPGMVTQLHLMADTTGTFYGESANISGQGFAGMHFQVVASSENDFSSWVGQVRESNQQLTTQTYGSLAKPSENNPPIFYASEEPGLYSAVITKYLAPTVNPPGATPS